MNIKSILIGGLFATIFSTVSLFCANVPNTPTNRAEYMLAVQRLANTIADPSNNRKTAYLFGRDELEPQKASEASKQDSLSLKKAMHDAANNNKDYYKACLDIQKIVDRSELASKLAGKTNRQRLTNDVTKALAKKWNIKQFVLPTPERIESEDRYKTELWKNPDFTE